VSLLTAVELCDVLIKRCVGHPSQLQLAKELRTAIIVEQSFEAVEKDPIRRAFEVASHVCGLHAGVDLSRRFRKGRTNVQVHRARHLAMFLLWEKFGYSTPQIAHVFGVKDHTTVMYGRDKTRELLRSDATFAERVQIAIAQCEEMEKAS
jgi:chromosomal replication initiation ATPase DnaA